MLRDLTYPILSVTRFLPMNFCFSNEPKPKQWFGLYTNRAVVPGCAGCAMAHPDFGRSVNPISTRGDRLCPPNYYWHTQIFRPSDGPEGYQMNQLHGSKIISILSKGLHLSKFGFSFYSRAYVYSGLEYWNASSEIILTQYVSILIPEEKGP